jgi:hypothetical protein
MDPITLLAALGPLLGKLGNAAIDRWVRPDQFKPATVDEVEKLARIEIDRFKALNEAGTSGPSYPWVNAIIQLQRPAVIAGLLAAALWQIAAQGEVSEFIANALGVVGSYLFMDRTLFHLSTKK